MATVDTADSPSMQGHHGEASLEASSYLTDDSIASAEDLKLAFRDGYDHDRCVPLKKRSDAFSSSSTTASENSEAGTVSSTSPWSPVAPWDRHDVAITTRPRSALILKDEQVIYQAAWYHRLLPDSRDSRYHASWWNQCKLEWNRSFWELAKSDETLREVFLSFAAAKKAAVQGTESSQGYYLHKGKALSLIRKDVAREGRSLRLPAIAAICLLFMTAFIEGDSEAAQTHLRAIAPLITPNFLSTHALPAYFWLLLAWADLRLTAIQSCPPLLPYAIHPEFNKQLPPYLEMRAKAMAKWNAPNLPTCEAFGSRQAVTILEKLYAFVEIQNQPDLDWKLAWSQSYQTAFALAKEYDILEQSPSSHDPEDHERVRAFLLAARILFWFSMNKFVTQSELQRHLLCRLMETISDRMPAELCFRFARSASLDVLLWILFATYISFVRVRGTPYDRSVGWLQATMKLTVKRLHLNSYNAFVARLRRLPLAKTYLNLACTAFTWMDGGPLVKDYSPRPSSLWSLLRLTFDPMDDVDRVQGHRPLEEIDSALDSGESRCTACIDKVRTSSQELFHFYQRSD